jgi:hypothetical protein
MESRDLPLLGHKRLTSDLRRRVSEPVEDQELPEEPAFDLPPFVELAGVIIDRHE